MPMMSYSRHHKIRSIPMHGGKPQSMKASVSDGPPLPTPMMRATPSSTGLSPNRRGLVTMGGHNVTRNGNGPLLYPKTVMIGLSPITSMVPSNKFAIDFPQVEVGRMLSSCLLCTLLVEPFLDVFWQVGNCSAVVLDGAWTLAGRVPVT